MHLITSIMFFVEYRKPDVSCAGEQQSTNKERFDSDQQLSEEQGAFN